MSEAEESGFLLVFIPTKEHIYLPYLNDPKTLATVFADVPSLELDEKGFIQLTDQKTTPEFARQHMDDQADLLTDFAAENNINYLDLTPYFREEAGTGAELYYSFDTHWNQLGHDLAAETINEYIKEMLPDTVKTTPGN